MMSTTRDDLASITELCKARSALEATQRRRIAGLIRELSALEGEQVIGAATLLEPYERSRLSALFAVAADR